MWQIILARSTRRIIAIALVALTPPALVGGASKSSSSASSAPTQTAATTHLAKTKFVLHAGLAFGAFHRYIYKPFKRGAFRGGLLHHKLATAKAALAAGFAYHEVKLALTDARSIKILSTLLAPLLALQDRLNSLVGRFKHGGADASAVQSAEGATSAIAAGSASAGQPISDLPTPSLGG